MHIFFNFFFRTPVFISLSHCVLQVHPPRPIPYRIPPEKFHKYDKKTTQI